MTPDFIPVFGSPPVAAGQDGVWVWRSVADDSSLSALSVEEAERVSRLVQPEKRNLLASGLYERRNLLAKLLGCSIAEALILHDSEGKPELPGFPGTELSLSDSHGWNALALSRSGPVGIDLEPARDLAWEAMLAMISEAEEAGQVRQAISEADSLAPFFRSWTAKEALLKATGTGMRGGPKRVRLSSNLIRGETGSAPIDFNGAGFRLDVTEASGVIVARAMQA